MGVRGATYAAAGSVTSPHPPQRLTSTDGVEYSIAIVDHLLIDEINILQATYMAMTLAVDGLGTTPGYVFIDGG
jgi:ribonuclease HII